MAGGGFVLMNLAFLAYAGFVGAFGWLVFGNSGPGPQWFRVVSMLAFLALLAIATVAVSRSSLPELAKATWVTVPLAAVYAAIGATLWHWRALVLLAGVLVFLAAIGVLRSRRLGWIHWWAVTFVSAAMLAVTLTGTDI